MPYPALTAGSKTPQARRIIRRTKLCHNIGVKAPDSLQRFLFEHAAIRGELVHLDTAWQAVLDRHDYPPPVRDLLGELMAAAALLSNILKFDGSLILQIQGRGPVSLLVVESTSQHTLRGMAQWTGDPQPSSFPELVGDGRFVITIDPKGKAQRYQGIVELEGETVAAALENYLTRSEQLDSRLWLAADTRQAAGMLLQKMPGKTDEDHDLWDRAIQLGATLRRDELLALPACEIIRRLYHEEDIRLFESQPVQFHCGCTRERVANALRLLGYNEIQSILEERGAIDVDCEFCNQHYTFDKVDAEQLFAAESSRPASPTRH
jgi:molecular chaperone Hsp33